ncbi:MAG: hypothetical protein ABW200_07875 [Hyphomicrobiaceae bacterium]
MLFSFGVLLILCGLGIMGFGLFIFYAWLPLFYALVGFEIGVLLGKWLAGDVFGTLAIVLGIVGAIAAAGATYVLEPYRRILLGYWGGALVALSLASLLGLEKLTGGFLGILLAVAGGVIGAMLTSRYFDLFVVVASAFGGATLMVAGAKALMLNMGWPAPGTLLPALITVVLSMIGVGWQMRNIAHWAHVQPLLRDPLADNRSTPHHLGRRDDAA